MVSIKQQFVNGTNRISSGKNSINYITIHETANTNPGATARAHANLQSKGNPREASWHYQVDDKEVIQSFPDTTICWHANTGNKQSIGIEICVNQDGNFAQAIENTVALVKILMARYNLNIDRIVQHHFWTGKDCPHFLRSGSKGISWHQFLTKITHATNDEFVLQYGDVGNQVKLYQDKLRRLGYQIDVDGSFGPATLAVVKLFQADYHLVVDGYLGPITQKKINNVLTAMQEGDEEQLNLTRSEREEIAKIFKFAHEAGVFSSAEHEKSIIDGTMTLSRLQYLQTIIAGAGINNGKRIK